MKVCSTCLAEVALRCEKHADDEVYDDAEPGVRAWLDDERNRVDQKRLERNTTMFGSAGLILGSIISAALFYFLWPFLLSLPAGRKGGLRGFALSVVILGPPVLGATLGVNLGQRDTRKDAEG